MLASLADASHLYKILKDEFNLSTKQFIEISENREVWTDAHIQQAVEYTRFKINRGQVKRSPAGYLMRALRDNWKMSEAERTMVDVRQSCLPTKRRSGGKERNSEFGGTHHCVARRRGPCTHE